MRSEERWQQIIEYVDQKGFLSVQELSRLCAASVITIRRDLALLDKQNLLRRTHGGAASLQSAPRAVPQTEEDNHRVSSLFDRLDALIASEMLPRYPGLALQPGRKKHIPVIAESLPMPDTETCVSVDNYQAGYDLGRWAAEFARQKWDGRVDLLDLTYHRPNTQARSQGFIAGLRSLLPGAELRFSVNTQSRYDMAYQLTHDALSVYPDINMIFAMNDISAQGAFDACESLGISPQRVAILTFGIEGSTMIDLMMQGRWIQAGVCMFPELVGRLCVEAAVAAYNRQPLPAQLSTPYCIVTPATLPEIYQHTDAGWRLQWEKIPCDLNLPLPVDHEHPNRSRPLPTRLGFLYTFIDHDWYKTLARVMKDYTERLGIQLEIVDLEQTLKDELQMRQLEIARRAAAEVRPGDTIFIDSGPISLPLAQLLSSQHGITVITNSQPVLEVLKDSPGDLTLIGTGGAYRRGSQSFVGPSAEATLKEFRIDKLFLMVAGASRSFGLSHTNISEVTIKQLMIRASREVILLADSTCFQQEALVQVAPLSAVHKIISDDALPPSVRLELGAAGISVSLAAM